MKAPKPCPLPRFRPSFFSVGIIMISMLAGLVLSASTATAQVDTLSLEYKAYGSGQLTGHIATLEIYNPGDEGRLVSLKPSLIPPMEGFQGYVIPTTTQIEVRGGSKVILLLKGFSTDFFRPPVPEGQPFPHPSQWIEPSAPPPLEELTVTEDGPYQNAGPWPEGAMVPTFPGSDQELPVKIDVSRRPEAAAPFLVDAVHRIRDAYDIQVAGDQIQTPFSGDPEAVREQVVQEIFWIYTAALQGLPYTLETFTGRLRKILAHDDHAATGTAPSEEGQFEKKARNLWETFRRVGRDAMILKVGGPGVNPPKKKNP